MRTKEQIAAEKKRLKSEYRKLLDGVAAILFRHDPIGINFESNTFEYELEAQTILARLRTCHDSNDVVTVAYEEFQKWFGADTAGSKESYRSLSEEIWSLWNKRDW